MDLHLVVFLSLVSGPMAVLSRHCPREWINLMTGEYMFVCKTVTWDSAERECEERGGLMASINSKTEWKNIKNKLRSIITQEYQTVWWIGLRYYYPDDWKWMDGDSFTPDNTPWSPGEPNNGNGDEDCAEFKFNGQLNDQSCSRKHPFICEKYQRINSTTVTTTTTKESQQIETAQRFVPAKSVLEDSTALNTSENQSENPIKKVSAATKVSPRRNNGKKMVPTWSKSIEESTSMETPKVTSLQQQHDPMSSFTVGSPKFDDFQCHFHQSTTVRSEVQEDFCGPERVLNIDWPRTASCETAKVPCPSGSGFATWECGKSPAFWKGEPNLFSCSSPRLQSFLVQVAEARAGGDKKNATARVAGALAEVTTTTNLTMADFSLAARSFKDFGGSLDLGDASHGVVKTVMKDVVKVGSNLMSDNQTSAWQEMSARDSIKMASTILTSMETATLNLVKSLKEPTVMHSQESNVEVELRVVDVSSLSTKELRYTSTSGERFSIPVSTLQKLSNDGLAKVVFIYYHTVNEILTLKKGKVGYQAAPKIISHVLSASLSEYDEGALSAPVVFTMQHTEAFTDKRRPLCSFLNLKCNTGNWLQEGCSVVDTNSTHTTCQCYHLTNFAILMDTEGINLSTHHQTTLRYITFIGCIISLICLLMSWLTFEFISSLQCERNSIHKNLVFCLFVSELIFMAGIHGTDNKVLCSVVAGFIHYFFLASFTWMLLEGINIVTMIIQVFDTTKARMKYYLLAGYGYPALIVAVSALVNSKGYGTEKHCWLSTKNFFVWSFNGPVAVILLVNAVILTYTLATICRHSEYVIREKSVAGNIRAWIQGALALEVLLGLTWVFGYFFINKEMLSFAYIFTVLNSLQGLFIFFFHCLGNKKVLKEYQKILKIKKATQTSTKSASIGRKQDSSHEMYIPPNH